jgi:hypothetical protein
LTKTSNTRGRSGRKGALRGPLVSWAKSHFDDGGFGRNIEVNIEEMRP